jgi:hypothetical protein
MSRVIFVDFDGVLHATVGPAQVMRQFVWLPVLWELLEPHADVRLVVHASARQNSPADFLRDRLGVPESRWAGVTSPRLDRWPSIRAWLQEHPETSQFRVLDDQAAEFPDPPPAELILCAGRTGVSDTDVQRRLTLWLDESRGLI